jgi:glucosylceramidase
MSTRIFNKVTSAGLLALLVGCFASAAAPDYAPRPVTVYATVKDTGQRLARAGELKFDGAAQLTEKDESIFVDASKTFQTVLGIGGALTDAAAETFYKLPRDKQAELLRAYFDPENGIGYSLGRTHINSCDFSSESYVYVKDGDKELKTFDIAPDLKYRIPFTKEALAAAGKEFTLYASPWSPPAWMKSNNDLLHGGQLKPEYYAAWADYFVKFIGAYAKQGIPIWGLTVQNEPMASQTWESCIYTAEEERDFVKNYLGPTLRKAGLADKKIMVWDHNRTLMYERAKVVLDDPEAAQYVWGVAFHWYMGDAFENVKRVHEAYPKVNLLFTEGCLYPFDPKRLEDWRWGELYANSMVNDFNNGAAGWTDWNVLLDEKGGPNHVGNFCYAPVHGDTRTGKLTYLSTFYYIGHFSKFVRPGARRVVSTSTSDDLQTTAFVNPDGRTAVIVLNRSERPHSFLLLAGGKAAKANSPAHSILTLLF